MTMMRRNAPDRPAADLSQDGAGGAYVYILECADGTFYTGWTNDLEKRVRDHNTPGRGAKYTRGRRPCRLVYFEEFADRETAMRREWEIKHRLTRREKEALVGRGKVTFQR